jgi:triacylglycerol lipase
MKAPLTFHYRSLTGRLARITPAGQAAKASGSSNNDCVVLLHGLARTHRSMNTMAAALEEAGYRPINMDYPSRKFTIERLAMHAIPEALRRCRAAACETVHFVTHSMGGILLRYYLSHRPIEKLGRAVMLSPPNHGSEAVDALRNSGWFRWLTGPAGQQLSTGPDGITAGLGAVQCPVGIITGNVHTFFDTWLSNRIPGEDDGKVSVQSARVEGMSDFLVLPYAHAFIMNRKQVVAQTIHFLRQGSFMRLMTADAPPESSIQNCRGRGSAFNSSRRMEDRR